MRNELVSVTRTLIEQAGWHDDRKIPIDRIEEELAHRGFRLNGPARAFLERFGALEVSAPSPSYTHFTTDPIKASSAIELHELSDAELQVGAALSPIGDIASETMITLMDDYERVFGFEMLTAKLFYLAESGIELLNLICLSREYRPVTEHDRWQGGPPPPVSVEQPVARKARQAARVAARLREIGWDVGVSHHGGDGIGPHGEIALTLRVAAFLEKYNGLMRHAFSPWRASTVIMWVYPDKAAGHISRDELVGFEQRVGARLCPIGEYGYGENIVLMDEHGRGFIMHDQSRELSLIAEDEADLIDFLLLGGGCGTWPVTEEEHWDRWRPTED
jgi:hypothetical protein